MTTLRLPGFIVGGAPRCGTTWLWHALQRHPDIEMAQPVRPEPKFFLHDSLFEKGLAHYSKTWFDALPADLQEVVMMDAEKQKKLGRKLVRKMQPKLLEQLKEAGVTVYEMTADEKKTMKKACKSTHDDYAKISGKADSMLKAANKVK